MCHKRFAVLFLLCFAATLKAGAPQRLPFGPNQCQVPYVFREAWTNDQVCVTTATRAQVARDNAAAARNVSPGPYGPQQCRQGLVWRVARPKDLVCVTVEQRKEAAQDNYYDWSRKQQRLAEGHKPVPLPKHPGGGAATEAALNDPGYHPGAGGVSACNSRYECPLRMKMAVEDDACVCGR